MPVVSSQAHDRQGGFSEIGTGTNRDRAKGSSLDGGEGNVVKLREDAYPLQTHERAKTRRLVVSEAAVKPASRFGRPMRA